jgi:hypothetical protein
MNDRTDKCNGSEIFMVAVIVYLAICLTVGFGILLVDAIR